MMRKIFVLLVVSTLILILTGCGGEKMTVSSVFKNGDRIPDEYTCRGKNVSPQLHVSGIPKGTKTLALIVDDPDAPIGTFVHWIAWNIEVKGDSITIPKAVPRRSRTMSQGRNDFGRVGYDGPCPPPGHGTHHYHFRVYALDTVLSLGEGAGRKDLERAMKGHILAQGELVGTYSR